MIVVCCFLWAGMSSGGFAASVGEKEEKKVFPQLISGKLNVSISSALLVYFD